MTTGLTLEEEARNTERHHSYWETDQRLRHAKIDFVSAGSLNPTPPPSKGPESAMADMTLDSPPRQQLKIEVEIEEEMEDQDEKARLVDSLAENEPLYFIDTIGHRPAPTGLPSPQARLRSSSPTPSDSSDEVILFRGRNNRGKAISRVSNAPRVLTDPIMAKIKVAEDKIHIRKALLDEAGHSEGLSSKVPNESAGPSSDGFEAILPKPRNRRGRRGVAGISQQEEDALVADYIANMEDDEDVPAWDTYASFNRRELGGFEGGAGQDETESPGEPPQLSEPHLHTGWDRSDICDFGDISTSDGVMGEVQAILSKRYRSSGAQYLVVWEGQSVDEARWVLASTLTSAKALLRVNDFEAEEKLVAEYQGNEEGDSGDSEDTDTDDELDEEDDEDLWQRKVDHMTDEQIARLLAKQEELGMGSNELLLLDDEADADEDEEIPLPATRFGPVMLASHKSRTKNRGAKRPQSEFPAATALADAYDGFDIMDFDRPSLKKKPKGRKGKLAFDLSDSELEATLQTAYENDRIKKKERKQQREALRAEGLLGSKNGKANLKDKYHEGMGIGAVKLEIKSFLKGNNTTLVHIFYDQRYKLIF
jgi:hypothetical protein